MAYHSRGAGNIGPGGALFVFGGALALSLGTAYAFSQKEVNEGPKDHVIAIKSATRELLAEMTVTSEPRLMADTIERSATLSVLEPGEYTIMISRADTGRRFIRDVELVLERTERFEVAGSIKLTFPEIQYRNGIIMIEKKPLNGSQDGASVLGTAAF